MQAIVDAILRHLPPEWFVPTLVSAAFSFVVFRMARENSAVLQRALDEKERDIQRLSHEVKEYKAVAFAKLPEVGDVQTALKILSPSDGPLNVPEGQKRAKTKP